MSPRVSMLMRIIAMVGVVTFAAMAIYFLIQMKSFWLDEACTGIHVMDSWGNMIPNSISMAHAPVYYVLLKLWCSIFGYTDTAIGFFSLTLFFIGLGVFYKLCHLIFKRKDVAIVGLLLMLTHYSLVSHAVEAKQYIWLYLLANCILFYFVKTIDNYSTKDYRLLLIFGIIGAYSHPWFLVFFFSLFLLLNGRFVWQNQENIKTLLITGFIVFIVCIPAVLLYWSFSLAGAASWIEEWTAVARYKEAIEFILGNKVNMLLYFLLLLASIVLGKIQKLFYSFVKDPKISYLVLTLSLSLLVSFVLDLQFKMVVGRYLIPLIPVGLLLILVFYANVEKKSQFAFIVLVLILLPIVPIQFYRYMEYPKHARLKEEVKELKQMLSSDDLVVVANFGYAQYEYYMHTLPGPVTPVYSLPSSLELHPGYLKQNDIKTLGDGEFDKIFETIDTSGKRRLFLIIGKHGPHLPYNAIYKKFTDKYRLYKSWRKTDAIYLYHIQPR